MSGAIPLGSADAFSEIESTDCAKPQEDKMFDKLNDLADESKIISLAENGFEKFFGDVSVDLTGAKEVSKTDIDVFETKDPELLRQYYELRHDAYRNENGWAEYDGAECEYDRQGRIIVALKNGKVVGGVRVMVSDECDHLSNEIPGTEYVYAPIIAKYDKRKNLSLFEISAVVVAKGERDGRVSREIFWHALRKAMVLSCHYICGVAMVVTCRDYRRIFNKLGYHLEIIMNRLWQKKSLYNFAKMFPMYVRVG